MQSDPSPLLGPNDPAPFQWINREPQKRFLLLNDHAGFHTPESLGDLGLSAEHWTKHIVGDWGMEALGRALVQRLKGSLIEGVYSRAVLDLNRRATDWDMAGAVLDGVEVPRNVDLSPASYAARIQSIHTPYHDEIERFLAEDPGHPDRVIIHCHSFTDCLMSQPDQPRPWEIGLLHYNATDRAAEALDWLRANTDYTVGDNEPYSLFERMTGSYALHSLHRDAPAITFEIRQDLLTTPSEISHWCAVLEAMIKEVF
jgi:predicted N-formylglutamate amidohydrolase